MATLDFTIEVFVQVDTDEDYDEGALADTAVEAVQNALRQVEGAGFSHALAAEVSIGIQDVQKQEIY